MKNPLHVELPERALSALRGLILAPPRSGRLSTAAIAAAADMPEASLRESFPGDDDLIAAAVTQALTSLIDALTAAFKSSDPHDPVRQFEALGLAYVHWSFENPAESALISSNPMLPDGVQPLLAQQNFVISAMTGAILEEAQAKGRLAPGLTTAEVATAARITVMGLVHLLQTEQLQAWNPGASVEDIVAGVTRHFIKTNFVDAPAG